MTPESGFPVQMMEGVPVVAAPAEIDITNADGLRTALAEAARARAGKVRGRHDQDPVL